MYLALVQDTLRVPRRTKRTVTEGQERQGRRSAGPRLVRYALRVSKDQPDFADVLGAAIAKWYESPEDFARKTQGQISNSSISRWLARKSLPSARKVEVLAPLMHIATDRLMAICYPSMSRTSVPVPPERVMHPLARELDRMLGDDSPLPDDVRELIGKLVDAVLAPYRRFLRQRKSA